jgi:hypothetical protein
MGEVAQRLCVFPLSDAVAHKENLDAIRGLVGGGGRKKRRGKERAGVSRREQKGAEGSRKERKERNEN